MAIQESIKREKVPKMDENTRKRIEELHFPTDGRKGLNAGEIWDQLENDNAEKGENYVLTSVRSIQRFIKKIREREPESLKFDRQPWSMLLSDKSDIPFDPILFRLLRLWFKRQVESGKGCPFVSFPVGIAKWAVRLHKVAPFLSEKELLYRARQYFAMERMAVLAGKLPDSSFDDLEIAMKDETDQELRTAYEELYGHKIKLEGQEIQSEDDTASGITVPENVAERIVSKKKKQRKNK